MFAVLHPDINLLLINERIKVFDDIGRINLALNIYLFQRINFLLRVQILRVYLLDHVQLLIFYFKGEWRLTY